MVTQTVSSYHCGSIDLIRFGSQNGRQRYKCHRCGKTSRENEGSNAYPEERKAEILAAYHELGLMRAMTRIFGVNRNTVLAWLKKAAQSPPLKITLAKAKSDVLELEERWSFVRRRNNKRWVWLAPCRRTRQIAAYAIGVRRAKSPTCTLGAHPQEVQTVRVLHGFLGRVRRRCAAGAAPCQGQGRRTNLSPQ